MKINIALVLLGFFSLFLVLPAIGKSQLIIDNQSSLDVLESVLKFEQQGEFKCEPGIICTEPEHPEGEGIAPNVAAGKRKVVGTWDYHRPTRLGFKANTSAPYQAINLVSGSMQQITLKTRKERAFYEFIDSPSEVVIEASVTRDLKPGRDGDELITVTLRDVK